MKTTAKIFFLLLAGCLLFSACADPDAGEEEWITVTFKLPWVDVEGNSRATGFFNSSSGTLEVEDFRELEHLVWITHVPTGQRISAIVTEGDNPSVTATGPAGSWRIEIQVIRSGGMVPDPRIYALYSGEDDIGPGTILDITMEKPIDYISSLGPTEELSLFVPLSSSVWNALLINIGLSSATSVNLDLSRCTDGGGSAGDSGLNGNRFNPNPTNVSYKAKITSITLPDAATALQIGSTTEPTFNGFDNLTTVDLGGVRIIPNFAFYDLSALTTVNPSSSVLEIGESAFEGTGLTSVNFSAQLIVNSAAFKDCSDLISVTLPRANFIGNDAFMNSGIIRVNFPEVTSVGSAAFAYCTALSMAIIPQANIIGDTAFQGCTALEVVDLRSAASQIQLREAVFAVTGTMELTIYFPIVSAVGQLPLLGMYLFDTVSSKTVNLRVGSSDSLDIYTDPSNDWENGFLGAGWNGSTSGVGTINTNINILSHPNHN